MKSFERAKTDLADQLADPVGHDAQGPTPFQLRVGAMFQLLVEPANTANLYLRLPTGRNRTASVAVGRLTDTARQPSRIDENGLRAKRRRWRAPPWNGG